MNRYDDIDSPDYRDHNLGDSRETNEEKEIARLQRDNEALRAQLEMMQKLATPVEFTLEENARLRARLAASTRPAGMTKAKRGSAKGKRLTDSEREALQPLINSISALVAQHGSLRAAARVLKVDVGYLSCLRSGKKYDPNESLMRKLGVRREVHFIWKSK